MTKVQTSVRVSPDTLAAIDAEAERLGVSRGAIIDRWLAEAASRHTTPIEEQALHRAKKLAAQALDAIDRAASDPMVSWQHAVIAAVGYLADATDALAGTGNG